MYVSKKINLLIVVGIMFALFASSAMAANQYPSQPIKVIVPFGAGGASDIQARIMSKYIKTYLGQDFVIVNIAGAGGTLGAREVLKSEPDGHTVLFHQYSIFVNYLTGIADFNYDAFTPVCRTVVTNPGFVARADAPWKDLREVVEEAKKRPEQIKLCAEIGGSTHFLVIPLQMLTDNAFVFTAAKGGDMNKITLLMGGHVDLAAVLLPSAVPYIQSGELKALAVASPERDPFLPDVPTARELGIEMAFTQAMGFYMPPNTPKDIVATFSKAIGAMSENEDYISEVKKTFSIPAYLDTEEFIEVLDKEFQYWAKVAEMAGLKPTK